MAIDTTDVQTRTIVVDGVATVVREAGTSGNEAVLFLHGHPGSSEDWLDLLPVAGQRLYAVAFDLPGFGRADKPADFNYTMPGYAEYVSGVLHHLGIERVHLVLHDFGCFVGLTWAIQHPGRTASIVFFNIGILPGYRWHLAAKVWRKPLLGELAMYTVTRPTFKAGLNLINPRTFPEEFLDRMYDQFDRDTRRVALKLYRSVDDPGAASEIVGGILGGDSRPVLVIWGMHDMFLPYTYARRQLDYFPNADIHILKGCGHWPFVDKTEQVNALLDEFYRAHINS